MSQIIPNGTYFISSQRPGASLFLDFTSASSGTNLTTWQYSGNADQQWNVAGSDPTRMYTVQNVRYKNYISWTQGNAFVFASPTPFTWYVRGYSGGYEFSPTADMGTGWNVDNGFTDNNNPVITYPDPSDGPGTLWSLTSTNSPPSSSSGSPSASGSTSQSGLPTCISAVSSAGGHGLSESDRIALGTAVGIGVPSFFVGAVAAFRWRALINRFVGWWRARGYLQIRGQ